MKIRSLLLALTVGLTFFGLLPFGIMRLNILLSLPQISFAPLKVIGILLIACGIGLFVYCSKLFIHVGKGTPVPIEPPTKLVTGGLYKITKNPIYVGYFLIFFGIALYFGHILLYAYALLSITGINTYVIYIEEPGLRKRFGKDYQEYCKTTPRWL